MHAAKKGRQGRGSVGKSIVHGVLDRATNQVVAGVVQDPNAATLQGRVLDATVATAQVYTDEATAYAGLARHHATVQHSTGEYVRDMAHTNGIESFWALMDRGIMGKLPPRQPEALGPICDRVAGRHNQRTRDTAQQMERVASGMDGKQLRYTDLVA